MPSARRRRWQEVDKNDILIADLVRSFLLEQEDRNHSPKTVRWYADMLGRFSCAVGLQGRLGDLEPGKITAYLRGTKENGVSKFTAHAYARTLKTFLRWLEREGYLEKPLSPHVQLPKVPRYQDVAIEVLSEEEIMRVLGSLESTTDVGCRDRAIVCLMLECGLRLEEVANLHVEDVHLKEMYLKVHGKGDKEAYVPMGPTTQKAVGRYLAHFRVPADPKTKALFLNIYGEPLKYEAIKSLVSRLAAKSGVDRLHPHLLRHTAATRMLANGADVHSVQRLLRHSDIRTTMRYLHLLPGQLQEQMHLYSPLTGVGGPRRRMLTRRLASG
ncbi:MAG TPA: tyrosine-type recombinase/integrase [Dehalococcoidia bacterium]|nr:tyrosine-type recombinase/integrase [Dehalococcoidia bacterium]